MLYFLRRQRTAVFGDFLERVRLPADDPRRISERSWYVDAEAIKAKDFDLKANNDNAPDLSDKRTPAELTAIIEEAQREIAAGWQELKA